MSKGNTHEANQVAYIVSMRAGLEAFIFRELEALEELGYSFKLFATKFRAGDIYAPKSGWPYVAPSLFMLALSAPLILLLLLFRLPLLLEALRFGALVDLYFAQYFSLRMSANDIRQIHCHFGDRKFFIGYFCKRITGLPLSVTIHAHEFYTNPNEKLFRHALQYADCVYPIAQKWCERLVSEYGVPEQRVVLNRLLVDTDVNTPSSSVSVLAVGRFTERKGFDYLIKSLLLLEDIDVHVVLVGFGELDLEKIAADHGVSERVTVFQKMDQKQLRYFYQTCDILCVPSITTEEEGAEGIPVVLMEGMACGIPVIATPCGAIEELVDQILVPERSEQAIADAIRRLAADGTLRQSMGSANRDAVYERFNVRNVRAFAGELDRLAAGNEYG